MKVLAEDTSNTRFAKARKSYKRAIEYYKESILYDEQGNPEVYHKLGETHLLMEPPALRKAKTAFKRGIDEIGLILQSKDLKSEDCTETTSKNITYLHLVDVNYSQTSMNESKYLEIKRLYSQMHAGMGLVSFLEGVSSGDESCFGVAMEYFDLGEAMGPKLRKPPVASLDSLWDLLDLSEVVNPVPVQVTRARLLLYRAKVSLDKGMKVLADSYLSVALDNLEQVEAIFPKDSRLLAEFTRYYFLKEDFAKCSEYLNRIIDTEVYADKVNYKLLKGDIYIKTGKYDSAVTVFTEILDLIPDSSHALVGRSLASAKKGDLTSALSDLETFLSGNSEDPRLFISAGHVYFILKQYVSSEQMFLKAYYKRPKDIEINFYLGKLYRVMGRKEQMKEAFQRVMRIGRSSTFAKEAEAFLKD